MIVILFRINSIIPFNIVGTCNCLRFYPCTNECFGKKRSWIFNTLKFGCTHDYSENNIFSYTPLLHWIIMPLFFMMKCLYICSSEGKVPFPLSQYEYENEYEIIALFIYISTTSMYKKYHIVYLI